MTPTVINDPRTAHHAQRSDASALPLVNGTRKATQIHWQRDR